jgi:hypothetical protein
LSANTTPGFTRKFHQEHGRWIHAFEINGFRKWSENKAVLEMAESLGYPTVTAATGTAASRTQLLI